MVSWANFLTSNELIHEAHETPKYSLHLLEDKNQRAAIYDQLLNTMNGHRDKTIDFHALYR